MLSDKSNSNVCASGTVREASIQRNFWVGRIANDDTLIIDHAVALNKRCKRSRTKDNDSPHRHDTQIIGAIAIAMHLRA
jgi:hypothetical protein